MPLEALRVPHARKVQHGGSEIEIERHFAAHRSRFDELRVTEEQRDADGRLVHQAFVVHAPLAEEEAMVRGEKDGGIVHLAKVRRAPATTFPTLSSTAFTPT